MIYEFVYDGPILTANRMRQMNNRLHVAATIREIKEHAATLFRAQHKGVKPVSSRFAVEIWDECKTASLRDIAHTSRPIRRTGSFSVSRFTMTEPACLGKWPTMSDPKWSKVAEIYCGRCPISDVCAVSDRGVSGPDGWVPSIGDDVLHAAATWVSLRQREGQTTITYSGLYQTFGRVNSLIDAHGFPLPKQGSGVQTWVFDRADIDAWARDVAGSSRTMFRGCVVSARSVVVGLNGRG